MVRPELGSKRTCVQCGTRFYDLGRQPAVCPKCGTEQPPEQPRLRRPAPQAADERKALPAVPPDLEAVDLDVEVDAPVLEDADVLEGEDEPIESDIDVETEGDDEAEP